MGASSFVCAEPGCWASPGHGAALHRISPKGGPFVGLCTEHMRKHGGKPEELAVLIEEANRGQAE